MVLYEFTRKPNKLLLELVVGNGNAKARTRLLSGCNGQPFIPWSKERTWHRLWRETILDENDFHAFDLEEKSFDDLTRKIDAYWERFKAGIFPKLRQGLLAL